MKFLYLTLLLPLVTNSLSYSSLKTEILKEFIVTSVNGYHLRIKPSLQNRINGVKDGIVSAKHTEAENVGYTIKWSCVHNLVESSEEKIMLSGINTISSLALPNKI